MRTIEEKALAAQMIEDLEARDRALDALTAREVWDLSCALGRLEAECLERWSKACKDKERRDLLDD